MATDIDQNREFYVVHRVRRGVGRRCERCWLTREGECTMCGAQLTPKRLEASDGGLLHPTAQTSGDRKIECTVGVNTPILEA